MNTKHTADNPTAAPLDLAVARFFADPPAPTHLLAAVSGGADSLAMLHSLHTVAQSVGFRLAVSHLNHGLRGAEADDDAAFVRTEAARLGLPYFEARADVADYARTAKLSTEDAARRARHAFFYQAMAAWGGGMVALAHTLDDQAETMLLHLLRGSGLDGLRGMRARTELPPYDLQVIESAALTFDFAVQPDAIANRLQVVRPILTCSRAETEAACAARGLAPRHDSSNSDPHYARNRVRHNVVPALAAFYNDDPVRDHRRLLDTFARLANLVEADSEYLDEKAHGEIRSDQLYGFGILTGASSPIDRRIVRIKYADATGSTADLTAQHVDAVLALMKNVRGSKEVHLPHGIIARRAYNTLIMTREKNPGVEFSLHIAEHNLSSDKEALELQTQLRASREAWPMRAMIDFDNLAWFVGDDCTLEIRPRRDGDEMWPLGAPGRKKLQDILVDAKIPAALRARLPIVVGLSDLGHQGLDPDITIWIGGTGYIDDRLKITKDTRRVLELTLTEADDSANDEGGSDEPDDPAVSADVGGH